MGPTTCPGKGEGRKVAGYHVEEQEEQEDQEKQEEHIEPEEQEDELIE